MTHQLVARRVEAVLQPGDVLALIEDQAHKLIAQALNERLRPAGAMMAEAEVWKLVWAVSTEQEKRWVTRRIKGAAKEANRLKVAA
jgi:hypothetical protein